ncbi:hypothetical protein [Dictyobacter vulcani]|uniref:hypothetical protein n=1 Tax=Dictyobacter vulcani TaxID=2607529 RepID=UPI0013874E3D|nr:hypothetical protein [Dictyobacter vulcani]
MSKKSENVGSTLAVDCLPRIDLAPKETDSQVLAHVGAAWTSWHQSTARVKPTGQD